jgi:hypothetical protein
MSLKYKMNEEKLVYNISKNERQIVTPVGRFTSNELEDIVEDPPIVDYKNYIKLRKLDPLEIEPVLGEIIPNINREDAFFYLTRGYLPNNPYIRDKINRYYQYDKLDDINKELIDKMYGDKMKFINRTTKHKYEDLVINYDKFMGIENKVRELAENTNINIDNYEDADEGLINEINYRL